MGEIPREVKNKYSKITEEDFSSIYSSSRNPVFVLNKKGEIIEINESFEKEIGVK